MQAHPRPDRNRKITVIATVRPTRADVHSKMLVSSNIQSLRSEYAAIRARAYVSASEFGAAVRDRLGSDAGNATPVQWVRAAREVDFACDACERDGIWSGAEAAAATNITCYRCSGKGCQNDNDRKRNIPHERRIDARTCRLATGFGP